MMANFSGFTAPFEKPLDESNIEPVIDVTYERSVAIEHLPVELPQQSALRWPGRLSEKYQPGA